MTATFHAWSLDAQLRHARQRDVHEARRALLDGIMLPRLLLLHSAVEAVRHRARRTADGDVPAELFADALWRADVDAEVNSLLGAADRVGRPQGALEQAVSRASALAMQLVVLDVTMPVAFSELSRTLVCRWRSRPPRAESRF